MTKLRILGRFTSINVRKVLWACDEMGIAYDREDWGLPLRDPSVPEFLALNPNAQVPVIVDDGFVLWESNAILRYLGDRERSDLWPADRQERARVDQWLTWQASELGPSWTYAVQNMLRHNPAYGNADEVEKSLGRWTKAMRILEGHLAAAGGFVANGRFSLADIVLGVSIHRWMMLRFEKPQLPAIESYYAAMQARKAGAVVLGAATP